MSNQASLNLIRAVEAQSAPAITQALKEGGNPFVSINKKTAWDAVIKNETLLSALGNKDKDLMDALNEMSQVRPSGFDQIQMGIGAFTRAKDSATFRTMMSESITERLVSTGQHEMFGGVKVQTAASGLAQGANFVKDVLSFASASYQHEGLGVVERALINHQFFGLNQPQDPNQLKGMKKYAKDMVDDAPISTSGYIALPSIGMARLEQAVSSAEFVGLPAAPPSFKQLLEQRRPAVENEARVSSSLSLS